MWVARVIYIVLILSGLVTLLFPCTWSISSGAAGARQFYVATTGNDSNPGTSTSAPWRTIQHAMSSATPGSTVNIMAGTYQERLTLNVSGTSGNYITFQPYNFSVPAGGCGGYTGVTCGGDQVILDYSVPGYEHEHYAVLPHQRQELYRCSGAYVPELYVHRRHATGAAHRQWLQPC